MGVVHKLQTPVLVSDVESPPMPFVSTSNADPAIANTITVEGLGERRHMIARLVHVCH
jgi:hypothetical protein